jgi:hypothetical protein
MKEGEMEEACGMHGKKKRNTHRVLVGKRPRKRVMEG